MSQLAESIVCAGCARNYKWKPALAGKKARCKCGQSVRFPADNPAEGTTLGAAIDLPPADTGGEYDVYEPVQPKTRELEVPVFDEVALTARCKGCKSPMSEGAILCTQCGMNQKTGKKLGTSVAKAVTETEKDKPASGAMKTVLMWIGGVIAAIAAVALFVGFVPQMASKVFAGVAIVGVVIASLGLIWSVLNATQDNIGLRLLCRFVPFVGIIVVIGKCFSDWDEMKVPVLTWIFGMGVAVVGYFLWIGAAVASLPTN
jgi:hypothetical protein